MRAHLAIAAAIATLLCSSCGSSSDAGGSHPAPGPAPGPEPFALLVRLDPEAAGTACAAGGTAVRAGLDRSGDGVLQDAEVERTSVVCADAVRPVLTRTGAVAADATCPHGGTRVEAGRDVDGDGTLDEAEVEVRAVVCSPPGAPPLPVLTRSEPLAPGDDCSWGGVAISAGGDADGDGILDPAEVSTVRRVCEDGRDGIYGFTVVTEADRDLLDRAFVVRGDVIVMSPTLEYVRLDTDKITGSIHVRGNARLQSVNIGPPGFARGAFVRGHLVVSDNPALEYVVLPGSGRTGSPASVVAGDLEIARNPKLMDLQLGLENLTAVDGSVRINGNAALRSVRLPSLRRVGGSIGITGNAMLHAEPGWGWSFIPVESIGGSIEIDGAGSPATRAEVRFPNLTFVPGDIRIARMNQMDLWFRSLRLVLGSVIIEQNDGPTGITFDQLHAIEGSLVYRGNPGLRTTGQLTALEWIGQRLDVSDNALLFGISLPSLRGASALTLDRNPALRSVRGIAGEGLAAIERLQTLSASGDPLLATCELQAIAARTGATLTASGTDDAAMCP